MARTNAEWHAANRMPPNATREQRIAWHADNRMPPNATRQQRIDWHVRHAEACACREVPASLRDAVAERRAAANT